MKSTYRNYFLMLKNKKILMVKNFEVTVFYSDLLPHFLRGLEDITHSNVTSYLLFRMVSIYDNNGKDLYDYHFISRDYVTDDKINFALKIHLMSCSDNYWVKEIDDTTTWEDIKNNLPFDEYSSIIQWVGSISVRENKEPYKKGVMPAFTTNGALPKMWRMNDKGIPELLKYGDKKKHIVLKECLASLMLSLLKIPHVSYYPSIINVEKKRYTACRCKTICTEKQSFVSAYEVSIYCKNIKTDFLSYVFDIDKEGVLTMCIADALLHNSDRHFKNWGFMQNDETGELIGMAPLFDHDHAFSDTKNIKSKIFPDMTISEAGKYAKQLLTK